MRRSKLSDHTFQKGKFITPINAIPLKNARVPLDWIDFEILWTR